MVFICPSAHCFCYFFFPLAIALSIIRLKDLKKQERSYQISGLITVFGSLAVIGLLIIIGVASSKWESDFYDAISQKDYAFAHSILDDHFQSDISAYSIDCYFELYRASGDYHGAETILEQYYSNGSGRFYISGGELYWQDDTEGAGSGCIFQKLQ